MLIVADSCGIDTATEIISIITTGITDGTNENFEYYPNPAGKEVTLVLPAAEKNIIIEIEDMNGKLLLRKKAGNTLEGMSFVVDLSGYENGIYFLRVSSDRFSSMQKLIIEK